MKGGGVCAKTENRTFATGEGGGGGCLKSEQVRTRGEWVGSKKHPIYANVIIEWSHTRNERTCIHGIFLNTKRVTHFL